MQLFFFRIDKNLVRCRATLILALLSINIATANDAERAIYFESKVRPLLIEQCYECHSIQAGESNGNLRLDFVGSTRRGGDRGPAVVPGDVDASLLVRAVTYADPDMEMPPTGKLSDQEIEILRRWVADGAFDPRVDPDDDAGDKPTSPLGRDPQSHWAFIPPQHAEAPAVHSPESRDLIDDAFLAAAVEKGITPSPQTDRATLLRRVYFDLSGLVPPHAQIESFQNDQHPLAYERIVDALLASPEFGERFARHWMDVARYADTVGYDFGGKDRRLTGSERYRDWTIRAFGSDMGYDDMIRHQLCGDRTDAENANGNLDAMGFLTVGRNFGNPIDQADDRIDVVTRGLLGLTVSCARCHDHKFDPIPTTDYYALMGVMLSSVKPNEGEPSPSPLMLKDKEQPHDERVFIRGQQGNKGDIAPRQFLTSLRKPDEPKFTDGSGRVELAERIVAGDNPLTYRVMANRIWSQLVGVPLVDTLSDFGFRTSPPVVPQVLDDLAIEFARHRSIKRLVRRIVTSTTYKYSSTSTLENRTADPENRYAMRGQTRRRDLESLRDSMLVVAGSLERAVGGEPVDITNLNARPRRTVYAFIDRQNLPGMYRTFDFASPDAHTPNRLYTTVPQQALFLMNHPAVIQAAVDVAQQIDAPEKDSGAFADAIFVRVLGRHASDDERKIAVDFLNQPLNPAGPLPNPRRLWQYGLATLDSTGFVTLFEPLKEYKDNHWQYSAEYPDPKIGYAKLAEKAAHPGNGLSGAVVRRWTATGDGSVTVNAFIRHGQSEGDGIRATFAIGERVLWQEVQKSNVRPIPSMTWPIKKGESLDLIADDNGSPSHDSFEWTTNIRFVGSDDRVIEANSEDDFSGPISDKPLRPLKRSEQLAQLLLLSNEFAFVD